VGWAFLFPELKKITCSLGFSSTETLSEASFLNIGLEQNQVKKTKFHPLSTCSMERRNGKRKEREVAFETVLASGRGKKKPTRESMHGFFT
jgi:hypothetical protein